MAISSRLWLILTDIILKTPIIGYNNQLRVANSVMELGGNISINYFGSANNQQKKKVHQETPSNHLETLDKQSVKPRIYKEVSNKLELKKYQPKDPTIHEQQ